MGFLQREDDVLFVQVPGESTFLVEGRVAVGDGASANFWTDRWLDVPIVDMLDNLPQYLDLTTKIQELILEPGVWNSAKLKEYVPTDVVAKVVGYPLFSGVCEYKRQRLLETYILGDLYFKVSL